MKKKRIDFQKLIDGRYPFNIELEVINWMLKTGLTHEFRYGWHRYGVDQHLFGYSANNHKSCTPFLLDSNLRIFVENLLFRGVVKNAYLNEAIQEWRKQENISLNTYRMLSFPEEHPKLESHKTWNLYWEIINLKEYVGKYLKKELFHSEYRERINPKIIGISFSTCGYGYSVKYTYSFENYNYEPGWDECISQKEGESIDVFIHRVYKEIENALINRV